MRQRALLFKSCSKYWPRAQLAINSARAHNPEYDIHVVTDGLYTPDGYGAFNGPALWGPKWLALCQPGAMLALIKTYDSVLFVDSDTFTYGPYVEAQMELDWGASVLVTPHVTAPLPCNDLEPSLQQIAKMGNYNAGFIGASRDGIPFLEFWLEWTEKKFTQAGEQEWLRFAADFGARLLRHPGYNWAYWNAMQRPLSLAASGQLLASGHPLRLAHFSGLTPDLNPNKMSRYQNRDRLSPETLEYQLFAEYQKLLVAGGGIEPPTPAL